VFADSGMLTEKYQGDVNRSKLTVIFGMTRIKMRTSESNLLAPELSALGDGILPDNLDFNSFA
jgi:hypothetical protein